ncbi:hypothetical protein [Pedobacter sp. MC2016-24]|uniref:hypothetical protein n=1 Tax=Pedobacter sp. MC2016-24 TaxID=2780090 RepID=UPI0018807E31|nr:hypothetical protein [Pedobacter sp. MC2016-24]MBE9598006.1 hypothetical protein [Pedobacter sp. MC2016-24]
MLDHLPLYLNISFIFTTFLSAGMIALLLRTASKPITRSTARGILATVVIWLIIQASLSYTGVYTDYPQALPPNIILFGVIPALITIIILFNTRKGKQFIDRLSMQMLSYVHIVRIPVELVLYGLFLNGAVPELMTFEGRNFDILAGITAPFVGFFGIGQSKMRKGSLLVWNFICLALLLNIVINAVLSTPSPFQQFAFDNPNIAILNFPYSWLPAFIVPLVLFAHLAAIRKLIIH